MTILMYVNDKKTSLTIAFPTRCYFALIAYLSNHLQYINIAYLNNHLQYNSMELLDKKR